MSNSSDKNDKSDFCAQKGKKASDEQGGLREGSN